VSQLDSRSTRPAGILVRRPRSNFYTLLLGIAAAAVVISCLIMFSELVSYGGWTGFYAAWKTGM
jgi:hypothetical protein